MFDFFSFLTAEAFPTSKKKKKIKHFNVENASAVKKEKKIKHFDVENVLAVKKKKISTSGTFPTSIFIFFDCGNVPDIKMVDFFLF